MSTAGNAAVPASERARDVVAALIELNRTIATAESLTGGLVCAALTSVPGSSAAVRGGLILYATDLKASVGGVDPDALAADGPVTADTAIAMALGARKTLDADVGVATTGVAGPDEQDGHGVGTVHVAVATPGRTAVRSYTGDDRLRGDRAQVRAAAVAAALGLVHSSIIRQP